jgi:hypothetical protein
MEHCDKNRYVREGLLANPQKYSVEEKQPLREHVAKCKTCQYSVNRQDGI